jgi:hypothetical protein
VLIIDPELFNPIGCLNSDLLLSRFFRKVLLEESDKFLVNIICKINQSRLSNLGCTRKPTSISLHNNLISAQRTELLLPPLHEDSTANAENVLALHPNRSPGDREANRTEVVIYLRDDLDDICAHLCADCFRHRFWHYRIGLDKLGECFRCA